MHRHYMHYTPFVKDNLTDLFYSSIDSFPYDLQPTSAAQGDLENCDGDMLEYAEEFTFEVTRIGDKTLLAGGWIEIRQDSPEDDICVFGHFTIAIGWNFQADRILPDNKALLAEYDLKTGRWSLDIDWI